MKKLTILIFLGFFVILANAQQKDNTAQLSAELDKLLNAQFHKNSPGATALVARKGQVIYKKAFGKANLELDVAMKSDQVFKIGSITKQFTAVAILQLMEEGKLSLGDEITRFIPDYPLQGNKITIEHLLTHTSGIRDYASIRDTVQRGRMDVKPSEMIDYFKNQPMRFAPGTRWEYSNSGYYLLGYIIETITGKSYGNYIEEKFFKPLGMKNSSYASDVNLVKNRVDGYTKQDTGIVNAPYLSMTHPYAAGSILSTVNDLFIWQQAVQSGRLIKKETLEKAYTRYKLADGKETAYGYGWRFGFIQESPSIWHGGLVPGFISMAMYLPNEDVYVAVFSNCDCNSPVDITAKMAALAIGKPYAYKEIPVSNLVLQGYSGVYENGKGQQRIFTVSGNQLNMQLNRSPKTKIIAYRKDMFYQDEDPFQSFEFRRNTKGEVETLVSKNRLALELWTKTDKPLMGEDGIKVDEKILDMYVGEYEVNPSFSFIVTREGAHLFLQAGGQEKLELFAETESKFFLKVNDAQVEFIKEESGKITKALLHQGGRSTEARRK